MRLVLVHDYHRIPVDVAPGETVGDLKLVAIDVFAIAPFLLSENDEGIDPEKLKLTHAGAELQDKWILHDIGIENGSTLRVTLMDIKPTLIVDSKFNHKKIYITENLDMYNCNVSELRTIIAEKTGLPVGVFRLVNKAGEEMFDCQSLRKYNVVLGQTVRLDVWDGWNDFLKASIMGFASRVLSNLSQNEIEAKYQLKVALHIAAFLGHVDQAVTLLKLGVRPDEATGLHPMRMWCTLDEAHVDSLSTPIHVAAARGHLSVIRSIVHHDITCVMAKDGHNCTPLQTALRKKQKACALFLITQQWQEIPLDHKTSIPLSIYAKMKSWCEKARHRAHPPSNPSKAHQRMSRSMRPIQSLVGNGVLIDGFSESKMKSKTAAQIKLESNFSPTDDTKYYLQHYDKDFDETEPERYFKLITSIPSLRFPEVRSRDSKPRKNTHFLDEIKEVNTTFDHYDDAKSQKYRSSLRNTEGLLKLPSIEDSGNDATHLNGTLSHSTGDLRDETTHSGPNIHQFNLARQSMPHLKLYHPTDDEMFHSAHRTSRSQSMFVDLSRRRSFVPDSAEISSGFHEHNTESADESKTRLGTHTSSTFVTKMSDKEFAQRIFKHYQSRMGVSSRQYASKCLLMANTFKEKPWLQRLKQARTIATIGMRRTFDGKPHLFVPN